MIFIKISISFLAVTTLSQGLQSKENALTAGALIEETDNLDMQEEISRLNGNEDIHMRCENLMRGFRNHLRGFTNQLKLRGIDYQPQLLSREQYDAIVNGDHEHGVSGG